MLSIVIRYVDDVAGTDNARLYLELELFQAYRGKRPEVLKIDLAGENVKPQFGGGLVLVDERAHAVASIRQRSTYVMAGKAPTTGGVPPIPRVTGTP